MGIVPKPVPRDVVCSECGLSWAKHELPGGMKTMPLSECVRLLKAELAASRPQVTYTSGYSYTDPATYNVINGGLSEAG